MIELLQFLLILVATTIPCRVFSWLWSKPTGNSLPAGTVSDLCRSKRELVVENAPMRQQLIVLRRQVNLPHLDNTDRALLVLLASRLRTWKSALFIVQPDTLLRWHKAGFRLFWKRKSRTNSREPKLSADTIELIKQMAAENRLWGAERIRGELIKLDIRVCKRTIQKYMRQVQRPGPTDRKPNQNWRTFMRNHASQIWAVDFLSVYDLFFRPLFIFFVIEHGSRRIVHFGVTRSPTDEWTAQQLREATPFGEKPRFLIRDNDSKYGEKFTCMAEVSGIEVLRTPYRAPKANALCERFVGSVRRECLDHMLILGEKHLYRVVKEYVQYYNWSRPHQGIGQTIPKLAHQRGRGVPQVPQVPQASLGVSGVGGISEGSGEKIISLPVLGGLHHDYQRVA